MPRSFAAALWVGCTLLILLSGRAGAESEAPSAEDPALPHWVHQDTTDPAQQTRIGQMYLRGEHVARDPGKANEWFRKAAEQGYALAQAHLGMSYLKGRGIEKDTQQALVWLTKAADQGNAKAQLELGLAYRDGTGVARDPERALMWLTLSAGSGSPVSMILARSLAAGMHPKQRQNSRAMVQRWRADHGLESDPAAGEAVREDEPAPETASPAGA